MLAADVICVYLAQLMFNEPKEDGVLGWTVCGLVVRNRVLAGWEGADWIALIDNHDKYSGNPPMTPRVLRRGDPVRDDKFRRCLAIAVNIYQGLEKDITKNALRYARLDKCSEEFAEKIVRPQKLNPENGCMEQVHARLGQVGLQSLFK